MLCHGLFTLALWVIIVSIVWYWLSFTLAKVIPINVCFSNWWIFYLFFLISLATVLTESQPSCVCILTVSEIASRPQRQHHWCVYRWLSRLSAWLRLWFSKIRATWLLSAPAGPRGPRLTGGWRTGRCIDLTLWSKGITSSDWSPRRASMKTLCRWPRDSTLAIPLILYWFRF